ncbi:MAG: tetratricopeptide repeat protein [Leptolyngbyaceae cyanobacterium bins.349]|nr:tetratricopeptide repeat protein [Leptolyngbyaceae cyanobacterium bins.349]
MPDPSLASSDLPVSRSPLEQVIDQYDKALQRLIQSTRLPAIEPQPDSDPPPSTTEASPPATPIPQSISAQVLEVLTARDRVQACLEELTKADASPPTGTELEKIHELDSTLKKQANTISQITQSASWRESFNPNEKAWWWFCKPQWSDRLDWGWSAITVTGLTVSLGLIGDIAPRFLTGGPDTFGAVTVSTQSVLTLLVAGGALTKAGQEALKRLLKTIQCPEKYWAGLGALGAVVLAVGFFQLRQSLPQIATTFYTNPGIKHYNDGDWSTAEEQFKRAIQLNAEDAQAHFQLGKLYEDLQMPDLARTQYQLAIQGGIPAATNNLARLNILKKKDYPAVVSLLLKTLESEQKQPLDPHVKHAVLKNLGWARLLQKNYPDAEARLQEAIDLESTTKFDREFVADTHCLMAQVMEAQGNKKGALPKWKICNQNANITIPEHDEWTAIAQKRLKPQEPGK